jgi:hypothetical protein
MAHAMLKITADGYKIQVLKFQYFMERGVEKNGRPSTPPKGGLLELTVKTPTEFTDTYFIQWLSKWNNEQEKSRSGVVEIRDNPNDPNPLRSIRFQEGQLVYFEEFFDQYEEGGHGLVRKLKITAKSIAVENATFDFPWI